MNKRMQSIIKSLALWSFGPLALFFLMPNIAKAEDPKISLEPNCRTFYAGREHTLTVKTQRLTSEGLLSWNLRYSGRTLASGQRQVPANGEVNITFKFPELNEGVITEVEFRCWVGDEGSKGPRAKGPEQISKTLYFFYPNPFKSQKEALKKLKIGVWEPNEEEALSEFLKSFEVPYAKVADPAGFDGKVLLVSGLDFDEFPGIVETLLKQVEKGKKVIILSPFSGTFPGFAEKMESIILTGNEFIDGRTTFGVPPLGGLSLSQIPPKGGTPNRKKFDTENWGSSKVAKNSLKLVSYNDGVGLEVVKDNKGFTYCEVRKGKGRMIITTWDIIKGAKESPTPVYLLKEMLLGNDSGQ